MKIQLGFFPIFLVFLTLKLTDTVNWSWTWVFAPIWIPISIFLALFALFFVLGVLKQKG
jgi:hypothetical protein